MLVSLMAFQRGIVRDRNADVALRLIYGAHVRRGGSHRGMVGLQGGAARRGGGVDDRTRREDMLVLIEVLKHF